MIVHSLQNLGISFAQLSYVSEFELIWVNAKFELLCDYNTIDILFSNKTHRTESIKVWVVEAKLIDTLFILSDLFYISHMISAWISGPTIPLYISMTYEAMKDNSRYIVNW